MCAERFRSLCAAGALCTLTALSSAAERWQRLEVGLGSATLFGNIRAQWPLTQIDLGSGDSLMMCLIHRLSPVGDSARSVFEIPQLTSWILELEPGHLIWKPPYLQQREFYLRERQWRSNPNDGTRVMESAPGQWLVTEPTGDRYLYADGELKEVQIGGRTLVVESAQGQISAVREAASGRELISAIYDEQGNIQMLNTPSGRHEFKWNAQLLTSVTAGGKPSLSFVYESELITAVTGGPGKFVCVWRENEYSRRGYTALASPVVLSSDGATHYQYSIADAVLTLRAKPRTGRTSVIHFFPRTSRLVREEVE